MHHSRAVCVRCRLAVALTAVLAACSGGGGGGGDFASSDPGSGAGTATTSATLAWTPSSGPVAGYRVFVSRDGSYYRYEETVGVAQVTLSGEPGETASIQVAAYDATNNSSPASPPSETFTFAATSDDAAASAAASDAASDATLEADSFGGAAAPLSSAGLALPSEKTPDDLTGNGITDVVWEAGDALRITTPELATELVFSRPDPDARVAALADFDGDGLADLLWEGADGGIDYTPMTTLRADPAVTPLVSLGTLGLGEQVVAAGDFDGDGLADVLVRDGDDGFVSIWFSNSGTGPDVAELGVVAASPIGAADYDGDGRDDILWRDAGDSLSIWLMDGALARAVVESGSAADSDVVGSGDFDVDGRADIALRSRVTGVVSLVMLGGDVASTWDFGLAPGSWTSLGVGDYDGDGSSDLLFAADAALYIAFLPGETALALDPGSVWSPVQL